MKGVDDGDRLQFSISRTLCTDNRNFFLLLRLLTQIANAFDISAQPTSSYSCYTPPASLSLSISSTAGGNLGYE